ncbi:MAG TPA: metallophosphoesterase [Deltaproteobacteria bacterium]|nr:metallophosphoesterase [Deltaproteobacteria bacterium]
MSDAPADLPNEASEEDPDRRSEVSSVRGRDEIRFAHLSDWHATSLVGGGRALLRPKRLSGWASWAFSRRYRHSHRVLEAAFRDLQSLGVDRILVTGDLTHVSLEREFRAAAVQLEALGDPERVFLIPGNHDCYVPVPHEAAWDYWAPYLAGGRPQDFDPEIGACLTGCRPDAPAPRHQDYPTLRLAGRLAMIGLCSAVPTPLFRAGGRLGRLQLDRLERLLVALEERGFFRVVMIHHPVAETGEPARRALEDAAALRERLSRVGAELVLHGHKHRRHVAMLPGPEGEIPSIGVPSSSEVGSRPGKRAQYHVYTVRPGGTGKAFELEPEIRGYDPATGRFERIDERLF